MGLKDNSSGKDPTKSCKDLTWKERGKGLEDYSDLARNSGRYERKRSPPDEDTAEDTV